MTLLEKSETLLRALLGPSRADVQPLACAVALTAERLYLQKQPLREFSIYKDVYYDASKKLFQKHTTTAKSVERLAKRCWDVFAAQGCTEQYVGRAGEPPANARTTVIYLATYVFFDRPYYQLLADSPELLPVGCSSHPP